MHGITSAILTLTGWITLDLPIERGHWNKWVFRNKKDERGIVIRNKARFMLLKHQEIKDPDQSTKFNTVSRHFIGCIKPQEAETLSLALTTRSCVLHEKLKKDKLFNEFYGENILSF
ncbi:hypothetical protein Tco_1222331 [Tanacetum coccineum]